MNEKRSEMLFKALLIIGAAIVVTGTIIRIIFGLLGHIVIGLGVIVAAISLYNYINNLKETITELRNQLNDRELEKK